MSLSAAPAWSADDNRTPKHGAVNEPISVSAAVNEWFTTFDAFMMCRLPALVKAAQQVVVNIEDARDIVAEVLPIVSDRFQRISAYENPDAYVVAMVRNRCLTYRKRTLAKKEKLYDPATIPEPRTEAIEEHFRRDEIANCLLRLSPKQRLAIHMRYYEQKEYSEIALELSIKESTIRGYVSEAYTRLREMLTVGKDFDHER